MWTKNKCPLCNSSLFICCIPNEETYYKCENGHTHKKISEDILNDRNKHLKLCQEIQNAKVKELKDELKQGLGFCGDCLYAIEKIDKIFEEETQAVEK